MPSALYNQVKEDEPIEHSPPFQNGMPFLGGTQRISPVSQSVFRNIQVGGQTLTYTVQNLGYLTFGDASDGDTTISTNTTLTADKYYKNLTINSSITLSPAGFRIFVSEILTLNGTISRNGNNGANAVTTSAGLGGAALADGYLKGAAAGGDGGAGAIGDGNSGTAGAATSNSIGTNGAAGGNGGAVAPSAQGLGGAAGAATASNVKLIANWHLATLLDVGATGAPLKFNNSGGSGGGGGGSSGGTPGVTGGGGGGAGSVGGIIAIYAKSIIINSGGAINAIGGNGGNGAAGQSNSSGGGGGAGANGGQIILVYNSFTNNGSISVAGGTGGTGGAGSGGLAAGASGNNGTAGTTRQFQVSL